MKKLVALLLVMLMALSLFAGCGGSSQNSASSNSTGSGDSSSSGGDTSKRTDIVIGMDSDPGTFNPYASAAAAYQKINMLVYQRLYYLTLDKEIVPILAEKYEEVGNDKMTYKVTLKQDIYDSEGNHITADDVIFSMEQHINGNGAATWKYSVKEKPFEKTGDYEITLYFKQQTAYALQQILTGVAIISKTAYEADSEHFVNKPIGTGPYVLKNWIVGSELVFEKNTKYWDKSPYKYFTQTMDKITFKVIAEAAQRAIELETGGVDFIYDPQVTDMKRFKDSKDVEAVEFSGSKVLNIYFNCSEYSKCQDVRMRQAIAYATDTQAIAVAACEGLATAAASIAHPIQLDWRDSYEGRVLYDQNIDKAKELVAALKADGKPLEFSIMTDENAMKRASATIIQEACKQVGITVTVDSLESAVFQSRYGDLTAWDAYMGQNGSQIYVTSLMTTQIDRTGYPNPSDLRDAIDLAFKEYDDDTSEAVVKLWEEEIPILPLVYVKAAVAYAKGLQNLELDISGMIHPGSVTW